MGDSHMTPEPRTSPTATETKPSLKDAIKLLETAHDDIESAARDLELDESDVDSAVKQISQSISILKAIEAQSIEGLRAKVAKLLRDAEDSTDYHNIMAFMPSCYDKEKVRQAIAFLEGTPEYRFEFEIDSKPTEDKRT